jgi:hypothetical protein
MAGTMETYNERSAKRPTIQFSLSLMVVIMPRDTHAGHKYRAHKNILAHLPTYFEVEDQSPVGMDFQPSTDGTVYQPPRGVVE